MPDISLKEEILETFHKKVIDCGIKQTKLDDVAKALRISKKTIYKYFESKDEMVDGVIENMFEDITKIIDDCLSQKKEPVEKYIDFFSTVQQYLVSVNQLFMLEIQENCPEQFKRMNKTRKNKLNAFHQLFDDCVQRKEFKKINSKVASQLLVSSITAILNPMFLNNNEISLEEAIEDIKTVFLYGVMNNK